MPKSNLQKIINDNKKIIDIRYDMDTQVLNAIINMSKNDFDLIYNGFVFGYVQGGKAVQTKK